MIFVLCNVLVHLVSMTMEVAANAWVAKRGRGKAPGLAVSCGCHTAAFGLGPQQGRRFLPLPLSEAGLPEEFDLDVALGDLEKRRARDVLSLCNS